MDDDVDLRPLLLEWLTLWRNQAAKYGSKMEFVYRNALKSLKTHPDAVYSARDCKRIKYFGQSCCLRVTSTPVTGFLCSRQTVFQDRGCHQREEWCASDHRSRRRGDKRCSKRAA